HPASGFSYRVVWERGQLVVHESYTLPGGERLPTRSAAALLTVGSGRLTFTSLGGRMLDLPDGPAVELFQLPVTRYRAASRWEMSPGYDRPDQRRFDRGISERCMFCHNGPVEPVAGLPYAFRPPLAHGITCERCHGPALAHVRYRQEEDAVGGGAADGDGARAGGDRPAGAGTAATRAADPILVLASLPEERRTEICQSCHLEGAARVLRAGRESIHEYRPGEPLGDLLWIFLEEEPDVELFTHSSHGERLLYGKCRNGAGRPLPCADCHPAHRPSPRDPGSYSKVCLRCHEAQACTRPQRSAAEHRSEKDPCTDCHMSWGGTSDVPHVTTFDHWIRRPLPEPVPGSEPVPDPTLHGVRPHHRGSGRLRPVIGPVHRPADAGEEATARAEAYLDFGRGVEAPELLALSRQALGPALAASPPRAAPWRLLARIEEREGRRQAQCRALQQVVDLELQDAVSWTELGICRGEDGDAAGSRQAFTEALRHAPRTVEALNRLGFLELLANRPTQAKQRYRQALDVDPTMASTHHNLAALHLRQGELPTAEQHWRQALALDPLLAAPVQGLVEVLVRQGKLSEARTWARQAVRLLPGDEVVRRRLAELEGR
ncbi:MAG: tetratricopeptide repeat protein, partial [Deltaproteobacteria bacterium]|nr:tetratricopeptide repeat protein [Deltaproteobacteria bacterium]